MSAIAKTLWLIESRFRETPSLDELAAQTGLSRSHLSPLRRPELQMAKPAQTG